MDRNISRRQAMAILGSGLITGTAALSAPMIAGATSTPVMRGSAQCSIEVQIIIEGLEPQKLDAPTTIYNWAITADDKPIWRSDPTSSLKPNEYGVATAIADLSAREFLLAFDPNTTVGDILAHPYETPPRYWEAVVFQAGSDKKVVLTLDVDMSVHGCC